MLAHSDPYSQSILECAKDLKAPLTIESPVARGELARFRYGPPLSVQVRVAASAARHNYRSVSFPGLTYPPLGTLWMVPVIYLPRWAWVTWTLAFVLAWVLLLCAHTESALWGIVVTAALTQCGAGTALHGALFGDGEIIAYILMGTAMLWLKRPVLGSIALALAVGSNQLAWVLVPAVAVVSARLYGDVRPRITAFVATLALAVGPLLLADPAAVSTMVGYFSEPTFPAGVGLIALVTVHALPFVPRLAFEFVTLGTIGVAVVVGWIWPRRALLGLPLSCAAFWFNWHSDPNYLSQAVLVATGVVVGVWGKDAVPLRPRGRRLRAGNGSRTSGLL